MANKKFTDLNATTSLVGTDLIAVTVDPATTPVSKKSTISTLMAQAPVQSVNTATGAVVLDADDIDDTSTSHKFVTASDITKLGGIEALADVTDATNVEAAGALMDNEVTNLAQVKAFDSADYATAAQGTLADSALQSVSAGDLTDGNFDGEAILGFKASLPTEITAATYTVQDSDNGQVIRVNHATGCTVTIPSGLFTTDSTGFNCSFIQVGNGQITFANDGTSVINNRQSHTKTNAQWAAASVVSTANNVFVLAGDTAS